VAEAVASVRGDATAAPPPSRPTDAPHLSVQGFDGPLDFLLEMVRRHQVDLGQLSILTLTDQLVAAIEGPGIPLERRAEWLVMASQLLLLKAQLLAPASPRVAEDAAAEAQRRLAMLGELLHMRAAARWLGARPQLGREVFARGGQPLQAPAPGAAHYVAFLEATLVMLEGREQPAAAPAPTYRPRPLDLWRVPEARQRILALLAAHPAGLPLEQCLPPLPGSEAEPARRRAALASSFVAGLELAREGAAEITQDIAFGRIGLRACPGPGEAGSHP
jgi:segregation and condensation protein A